MGWRVQELSQWRSERAQEALKNSVLDEEAAARFSTAAALAQKHTRDQAAKHQPPPQLVRHQLMRTLSDTCTTNEV